MINAVETKNLSVSYNRNDAVNNISLTVKEGEFLNVVGPNGGGKTTFIKAVLGLIKPHSGSIKVLGDSIKKNRQFIGYVPQNAETEKNFPITVTQAVETAFLKSGLNPFKKITETEQNAASKYLKLLGIENLANRQINQLSGGEFQRLLIARALCRNPKLLFLDEPTANIDPYSANKIMEILEKINYEGCTVIMVSHDLHHVLESNHRTVFINRNVLFDGIATQKILELWE